MTDQQLGATVESLREFQRETSLQMRETDRRMQETDRLMQETALRMQETDRFLKEVGRQLGGLGDKFGSFTEGLALPSMTKILTERFHMSVVSPSVRVESDGRAFEIDVLAYSGKRDEVYVVEVKSHLRMDAIRQIKRILREFHDFIPGHRGKRLYGILAGVDAPKAVRERVLREGIYLAIIHDEEFELQVPADFQPRAF